MFNNTFNKYRMVIDCLLTIIGALIISIGFNLFLVPHKLLSGGVAGISMILHYVSDINMSILYFALNLPLLILGLCFIGKKFIAVTTLSVISTTVLLAVVPVITVTTEPLLTALFGGVLVGVGAGITFRVGGCSGGFDILGSVISKYRDFSVGNILICLNAVVVLVVGYRSGDWNLTLCSTLAIYVTGKVVNFIYIGHDKVTLYITSEKTDELITELLKIPRGVTKIKTEGAFTGLERDMIMTVTTKYELVEIKQLIRKIDPKAFVNITETLEVLGYFRKVTTH